MFLPSAVGRHVGVGIGSEVPQGDQGFGAGVFDFDPTSGSVMADEHFVVGVLAEADHGWGLQGEFADATLALDGGPAAGRTVLEDGLSTWLEGDFFGAE